MHPYVFSPFQKLSRHFVFIREIFKEHSPLSRISEYLLNSGTLARLSSAGGPQGRSKNGATKKCLLDFSDEAGLACSSASKLMGGTKTWDVLAVCERILSLNSSFVPGNYSLEHLAAQNYSVRDFVFREAPTQL